MIRPAGLRTPDHWQRAADGPLTRSPSLHTRTPLHDRRESENAYAASPGRYSRVRYWLGAPLRIEREEDVGAALVPLLATR